MKIYNRSGVLLIDVCGANLRGANLRGADLREANLRGADLRGADLRGADLRGADLCGAALRGANLRGANLCEAYLREADLCGANLREAYLREADLCEANLREADLCGANLRGADLCGAALRGANLRGHSNVTSGTMKVYKKASGHVVELIIPSLARRMSSLVGRKCRCEFAYVKRILNLDGSVATTKSVCGDCNSSTQYTVGTKVTPDKFDDDIRIECTHGIHFFLTFEEAAAYV